MYRATANTVMPTTVIGSLPRPSWYTENLGARTFIEAMSESRFREQYTDAVGAYIRDQEIAGLDIYTDGDARFDADVGGLSWALYPARHMTGFANLQSRVFPWEKPTRGTILSEVTEARVMPHIVSPIERGDLQYTAIWKTAQRLTQKPIKFGTIAPDLLALQVADDHYTDVRERIMALSDAFNRELTELAKAGCAAIQIEDPQVHMLAAKGIKDDVMTPEFSVEVFNNTVKGLREYTEVWCHCCWGNAAQQRAFDEPQSYGPALEAMNNIDADIITFECCSTGGMDLEAIAERIVGKKIAVGAVDHHTLQVESANQVAALVRRAAKAVSAERLVICSDCGMGRDGMSRRHAFYKMVAITRGTNIVRRELGLPESPCLAADERFLLNVQ
jgi:5-methyltetrahydropteroyltriglutamate--homocysteine methyltransferase